MFDDRTQAGEILAQKLVKYKDHPDTLILALPRGGLPVAEPIAHALSLPLDIIITRKIGHPYSDEFALGAISEYGSSAWKEDVDDIDNNWVNLELIKERAEIDRRKRVYLGKRKRLELEDKTVILVDDGAATGMTTIAALKDLKKMGVKKIVIALPVAPYDTAREIKKYASEIVCLYTSPVEEFYGSVGAYYNDFSQVGDAQVKTILKKIEASRV